jgi:hypothetical protein
MLDVVLAVVDSALILDAVLDALILDAVLAAVDCAIMKSCPVFIADIAADRFAAFGTMFALALQTLVQCLERYQ